MSNNKVWKAFVKAEAERVKPEFDVKRDLVYCVQTLIPTYYWGEVTERNVDAIIDDMFVRYGFVMVKEIPRDSFAHLDLSHYLANPKYKYKLTAASIQRVLEAFIHTNDKYKHTDVRDKKYSFEKDVERVGANDVEALAKEIHTLKDVPEAIINTMLQTLEEALRDSNANTRVAESSICVSIIHLIYYLLYRIASSGHDIKNFYAQFITSNQPLYKFGKYGGMFNRVVCFVQRVQMFYSGDFTNYRNGLLTCNDEDLAFVIRDQAKSTNKDETPYISPQPSTKSVTTNTNAIKTSTFDGTQTDPETPLTVMNDTQTDPLPERPGTIDAGNGTDVVATSTFDDIQTDLKTAEKDVQTAQDERNEVVDGTSQTIDATRVVHLSNEVSLFEIPPTLPIISLVDAATSPKRENVKQSQDNSTSPFPLPNAALFEKEGAVENMRKTTEPNAIGNNYTPPVSPNASFSSDPSLELLEEQKSLSLNSSLSNDITPQKNVGDITPEDFSLSESAQKVIAENKLSPTSLFSSPNNTDNEQTLGNATPTKQVNGTNEEISNLNSDDDENSSITSDVKQDEGSDNDIDDANKVVQNLDDALANNGVTDQTNEEFNLTTPQNKGVLKHQSAYTGVKQKSSLAQRLVTFTVARNQKQNDELSPFSDGVLTLHSTADVLVQPEPIPGTFTSDGNGTTQFTPSPKKKAISAGGDEPLTDHTLTTHQTVAKTTPSFLFLLQDDQVRDKVVDANAVVERFMAATLDARYLDAMENFPSLKKTKKTRKVKVNEFGEFLINATKRARMDPKYIIIDSEI